MRNYLDLCRDVILNGKKRHTRSGTVFGVFRREFVHDMRTGDPIATTKKFMFNPMVGELLWFMNTETDLPSLRKRSCLKDDAWTIWTNDCRRWRGEDPSEDTGRLYGTQWRSWADRHGNSIDQIHNLIETMKNDPTSRYLLVQAWNPGDIANQEMALPPCHIGFQVYVDGNEFDLDWTQRSVDVALGLPFNIGSYALLMRIIGKITGLTPRFLSGSLKDTHVYEDHVSGLTEQLSRTPLESPTIVLPPMSSLDDLKDLTAEDFQLVNYRHHERINMKLSVG